MPGIVPSSLGDAPQSSRFSRTQPTVYLIELLAAKAGFLFGYDIGVMSGKSQKELGQN